MIHRRTPLRPADRMGVVETDQPFARRPVKRERLVEVVRLLRRDGNPRDHELHPMTAIHVHDEYLSVEVEKRVEAPIATLAHRIKLSEDDNIIKPR